LRLEQSKQNLIKKWSYLINRHKSGGNNMLKLIKTAEIDPIQIKKKETSFFSRTVSAIVLANALVLMMIYITVYSG